MATVWLVETTPYDSDLLLDVAVYATREESDAAIKAVWDSGRAPTRTLMSAEEFASECFAAWSRVAMKGGRR